MSSDSADGLQSVALIDTFSPPSTSPSAPAGEQDAARTDASQVVEAPASSHDPPTVSSALPKGVSTSHDIVNSVSFIPGRFFLDICAGASRPLSTACHAKGLNVFSVDILLDSTMDILDDQAFEQLLRICSSGQVAHAGSPSCGQYSRLKLRQDGGPRDRTT